MLFKKYIFLVPLLFILIAAYCRYTYILNPNFSGAPFFIKIMRNANLDNQDIGAESETNIISILIFWVVFLSGNAAFFMSVFQSSFKTKSIIALFLLISFASASFFTMNIFLFRSPVLFNLASILKNFILTPAFTAGAYILFAYFPRLHASS